MSGSRAQRDVTNGKNDADRAQARDAAAQVESLNRDKTNGFWDTITAARLGSLARLSEEEIEDLKTRGHELAAAEKAAADKASLAVTAAKGTLDKAIRDTPVGSADRITAQTALGQAQSELHNTMNEVIPKMQRDAQRDTLEKILDERSQRIDSTSSLSEMKSALASKFDLIDVETQKKYEDRAKELSDEKAKETDPERQKAIQTQIDLLGNDQKSDRQFQRRQAAKDFSDRLPQGNTLLTAAIC